MLVEVVRSRRGMAGGIVGFVSVSSFTGAREEWADAVEVGRMGCRCSRCSCDWDEQRLSSAQDSCKLNPCL